MQSFKFAQHQTGSGLAKQHFQAELMSRPLRLELAGGLYHITSRGDGREDIRLSDTDMNRPGFRGGHLV